VSSNSFSSKVFQLLLHNIFPTNSRIFLLCL
jgi:hypothetical protein